TAVARHRGERVEPTDQLVRHSERQNPRLSSNGFVLTHGNTLPARPPRGKHTHMYGQLPSRLTWLASDPVNPKVPSYASELVYTDRCPPRTEPSAVRSAPRTTNPMCSPSWTASRGRSSISSGS